jgi:hypothetical protein
MESEFLLDSLLECLSLFQGQGVGFGNNGDNVNDVRKLLKDDDIDGLKARNGQYGPSNRVLNNERMAGWLNEEKTAVNTCVLDVTLALSCELLAEVGRVLIFDVFDDGVPANSVSTSISCSLLIAKSYHRSLLTWSPYPGVSTMLSLRRTPFSSMTIMTAC